MPKETPLDPDIIKSTLPKRRIGKEVVIYETTYSTNDAAARYIGSAAEDGLVVFAESQSAGRGRLGAKWQSPEKQSLLFSILLRQNNIKPNLMSLAAAVAVADGIGTIDQQQPKIKWPNDILLGNKKLAGILVESQTHNRQNYYIVGVGINCRQKPEDFPPEIRDSAISLDMADRKPCCRTDIAKQVLTAAGIWFAAAAENPEAVRNRWRQLSLLLGRRITVVYKGRKFTGNCEGVDPDQGLILRLERGTIRMFDAAHCRIAKDMKI